jgi:cell division septation protein DedD
MDQGLKERLIGAAVLVALGVWLIPLLLDGPDDGAEDGPVSLQLPIPGVQSAPVRTEVVDLNAAREPQSAVIVVDDAAAAERARRAAAAPGAEPAAVPSTARSSDGGAAASSETVAAAEAAALERAAELEAAAASAGTSAPAQTAAPSEPAASAPVPESPPRRADPPMASGDWAIQLGSFGEEENARRLAERVAGFGFEPRISDYRAGGRTMYRVRVGPHPTRAAAEAAASSLSAHGFVAQVVTVE